MGSEKMKPVLYSKTERLSKVGWLNDLKNEKQSYFT